MKHHRTIIPYAALIVILFGAVHPAFAQEADVDAEIQIMPMPTFPKPPRPPADSMPVRKPLDAIRERALNAQQNINESARGARQELLKNTQMQLQNASGTQKRDILKDAAGERREIMRNRMASSTGLKLSVKAAVQMHGGQIRTHFANAIRHLNQFMARIDARMDKLAAAGADISSLIALQADAEASIDAAEADIKAIQDYVATITEESDRAAIKSGLESRIKEARASLKEAHADVRALIKALGAVAKPAAPAAIEASADSTIE